MRSRQLDERLEPRVDEDVRLNEQHRRYIVSHDESLAFVHTGQVRGSAGSWAAKAAPKPKARRTAPVLARRVMLNLYGWRSCGSPMSSSGAVCARAWLF